MSRKANSDNKVPKYEKEILLDTKQIKTNRQELQDKITILQEDNLFILSKVLSSPAAYM